MVGFDADYQERLQTAIVAAIMRVSAVELAAESRAAKLRRRQCRAHQIDRRVPGWPGPCARSVSPKEIGELGDEFGRLLRQKIQAILDSGKIVPAYYEVPKADPSLN